MIDFSRWRDDLTAGLTGAVAGAPQAMGFALIAGVNPAYGLYTALVSTIVGALVGNSTYMTVGPTNALSLVVASTLINFEGAAMNERLFVLTLLVGVFTLLFGVLRLGLLVRFVSNAVMTGFITGAGLLIIFGQVRHLNGYQPTADTTLLRFFDWLAHLHLSDPRTMVVGVGALVLMVLLGQTRLKNLSTLVAIVLASIVVLTMDWGTVALVRDESPVPPGLPMPMIPDVTLVPELAAAALAMAVLGAVQSAAIVNSVPEPEGQHPNTNRDFVGIGLGNVAGAFFQSMPACGSLSRTAVNVNAGAQTRWSNAFSGVFIGVFLLLFSGAIEVVTLAALAAQLVVAASSLIRPREIVMVWRVNPPARVAMIATFVSTLVLPLEYSIYIGVGLSLALYLYTSSENVDVVRLIANGAGRYRVAPIPEVLPANDTVIFSISGHLYFAAIDKLESLLPPPDTANHTTVILRLRENHYLGSTGVHFLQSYWRGLRAKDSQLVLTGVSPDVHAQLVRSGFIYQIGADNVYDADEVIFEATTKAYQQSISAD